MIPNRRYSVSRRRIRLTTLNAVCRPADNFLLSANPFPGCVPLAFSGVASASVAPQAVTLDCCQSSDSANPLLCSGAGGLFSLALLFINIREAYIFVNISRIFLLVRVILIVVLCIIKSVGAKRRLIVFPL